MSVDSIPLPDQMPAPLDLDRLPKDLLHSSTVENLLNQNQDLMARLAINIRRVTDIEIALRTRDENIRALEAQKEALKEELEVINEKYRIIRTSTEKVFLEKNALEKSYALTHSRHQEIQGRLQEENFYFRGLMVIMRNYRRRILKYVRPLVRRQRQEIFGLRARSETVEKELLETREWMQTEISKRQSAIDRLVRYRRRIRAAARPLVSSLRDENSKFRTQIGQNAIQMRGLENELDAVRQILNDQQSVFDRDQTKLVSYHEERYQEIVEQNERLIARHAEQIDTLQNRLDGMVKDFEIARERIQELTMERDGLARENAEFENRVIRAERTQDELSKKRISELNSYEVEIARLKDMVEKLNVEAEESRAREGAANGLNRKLSQDLQGMRKEAEQLRLRIRSAKSEEPRTVFVPPPPQMSAAPNEAQLGKIERILAEIQTGHSGADIKEKLERGRSSNFEEIL